MKMSEVLSGWPESYFPRNDKLPPGYKLTSSGMLVRECDRGISWDYDRKTMFPMRIEELGCD